MDSYIDDADVSRHEYPPPRGKGSNHSQHGMSGFGGVIKGYPPFDGHGKHHGVFRGDKFYKHSESQGNHQSPWNIDDPLMMTKQCWPESCPTITQHMRNDAQDKENLWGPSLTEDMSSKIDWKAREVEKGD